jgi:uncharacterized protein YciI
VYYLLFYDVVDGFAARRVPFRDAHLERARAAHERGELVMAGAHGDPVDGAVLLFATADRAVAERFAADDPYVQEGLVTAWRVRPWHVVIGGV